MRVETEQKNSLLGQLVANDGSTCRIIKIKFCSIAAKHGGGIYCSRWLCGLPLHDTKTK